MRKYCVYQLIPAQRLSSFLLSSLLLLVLSFSKSQAKPLELGDDFMQRDPAKQFLVKFYAPWCGHCRSMEPAYDDTAKLLSNTPVTVGRIDATVHQAVAAEFRIRGFPTVMFISGDNRIEYRGERTAEEMVKFVNRVNGDAVRFIPSPGKFSDALQMGKEDPFFLFVGQQESPEFSVYNYIAGQLRADSNFYRADADLLGRLPTSIDSMRFEPNAKPISEPAVLVFKDGGCLMFPGNFDNDSLGVWINDERHRVFPKISDYLFYTFYPTTKLMLVLIANASDKAGTTALVSAGRRVAMSMHPHLSKVQFAWTESLKAASDLAMTSLPPPNVIMMNPNTTKYYLKQDYHQPITDVSAELLRQLAADALADKLPGYGGSGVVEGIKRTIYDFVTGLVSFIISHPGLALVVVGAPVGVVSILCYAICCMDSDADDDDDAALMEEEEEGEEEEEDGEGVQEISSGVGDVSSPEEKKDQ